MSTPAQFAAKCNRFASTLPRETTIGTMEAAQLIKLEATRQLRAVVPSGKIRKGKSRLGVTYSKEAGSDGSVLVRATGPWQLIESDTSPHAITSRHGGSIRRKRQERASFIGPQFAGRGRNRRVVGRTSGGRRAVMFIPGVGYRRSALHPGTRGKHPWEKAMQRSPKLVFGVYNRALNKALVNSFAGG